MTLAHRSWKRPYSVKRQLRRFRPQVEELEAKVLPSGLTFEPTYLVNQPLGSASPFAGGGSPSGLSPSQIRTAYGLSGLTFGNVAADGTGTTIAIVDAYDDPSISNDLAVFDSTYGLSAPASFTKIGINTAGNGSTTTFPTANSGWAGEIELDVEWSHVIAPGANIILVEAHSNSDTDLLNAVNYARNYAGVVAVSMSWGGSEFSGESLNDSYFTTPAGHTGVTFFGSAGDNGAPAGWPSLSSHVVGVGGTTLSVSSSGSYLGESGWSGGGGSISTAVTQPSYQSGLVIHNGNTIISANGMRAGPDVAYNANPSSGVAVYGTYGFGGWIQVGGTSAGSPQWAGIIADVDQGRALAGLGSLDGYTQTLPLLYQHASDFHDVMTGSNGYSAGPGYDLVTGLGTPMANKLIPDLVGTSTGGGGGGGGGGGATPPTVSTAAHVVSSTSTAVTLNAVGNDAAGANTLTYTWSVVSAPAGGSASFSPNGTNAAQTTVATLSAAGSYTFQVTITDPSNLSITSQVSYSISAKATSVSVSPASATVADKSSQQFTATVKDQFGVAMSGQSVSWQLASGIGTLSTSGLYQAPTSGTGSATIRATSGSLSGTASVTVVTASTTGPTITTPAHVVSSTSTTATLSVAATDPAGASSLTYTWSLTGTPPGTVTANRNGTNASSTITANFSVAGTYNFLVTVRDRAGHTATSAVSFTLSQVATTVLVSPGSVSLATGATQQFTATAYDQFGRPLVPQPASFTWSVTGAGTITTGGLFTAGSSSATVTAADGSVIGQASVSVAGAASSKFTSPDVPAPLQYWTVTYSYLNVSQSATIGSLTVQLSITYPNDGNLMIDLISPGGTDVTLSYFDGAGSNFTNTTFADTASTPVYTANSPFAGTFQPETPLSALVGQNAVGTWMLAVSNYGYYSGQVTAWSISLQAAPASTRAGRRDVIAPIDSSNGVILPVIPSPDVPSSPVLQPVPQALVGLAAVPPLGQNGPQAILAIPAALPGMLSAPAFVPPIMFAAPTFSMNGLRPGYAPWSSAGVFAGAQNADRSVSAPDRAQPLPQDAPPSTAPESGEQGTVPTQLLPLQAVDAVFAAELEPASERDLALAGTPAAGFGLYAELAVLLTGSSGVLVQAERTRRTAEPTSAAPRLRTRI